VKAKTYDEWRELGYQVRKGEKSTGRNKDNRATFTRDQVDERDQQDDLDEDFYMDHPGDPANYGSN